MKQLSPKPRTYRISTQIKEEYGVKLEELRVKIRKCSGKKLKIGEILELAIEELERADKDQSFYIDG